MNYQHKYTDGTTIPFKTGKVVCIGRNYAEHIKELNNPAPTEPMLFIKPATSIVDGQGGFFIPKDRGLVHYEIEIAVLIGKSLSGKVSSKQVSQAIVGFAPALDLTLRDLQNKLKEKGLPWEICKGFDGACVLPPFIPAATYPDLTNIDIRLTINDEIKQYGNSRDMLVPIIELIQYITNIFTLLPGDVILTGTPKGVGPLNEGDTLIMELPEHSLFTTTVL